MIVCFTDTNSQDISAGSADHSGSANGSGQKRSGREYVPKVGSGGYAILLALYLESQTQGTQFFLIIFSILTINVLDCFKKT